MSFHKPDDPSCVAVVAMGEEAAPHLFRAMREHPHESVHFCYNVIPLLIKPPQNIVERMNNEAISKEGGFVGLDVKKMEEIYLEWGEQVCK